MLVVCVVLFALPGGDLCFVCVSMSVMCVRLAEMEKKLPPSTPSKT